MLYARRRGALRYSYEISNEDDLLLTTLRTRAWHKAGEFELGGWTYAVRTSGWTHRGATLLDERATVLAVAEGVGSRRWTVRAGGTTHEFERASLFRSDQALVVGGNRVGFLRRSGLWGTRAQADLPGLPLPVAVFAFAVTLMLWARNDAAAAS